MTRVCAVFQDTCVRWTPPSALLSCTRAPYLTASSTLRRSRSQVGDSDAWSASCRGANLAWRQEVMLLERPPQRNSSGWRSCPPPQLSDYHINPGLNCGFSLWVELLLCSFVQTSCLIIWFRLCSSDSDEDLDDKHEPEKGLIQRVT